MKTKISQIKIILAEDFPSIHYLKYVFSRVLVGNSILAEWVFFYKFSERQNYIWKYTKKYSKHNNLDVNSPQFIDLDEIFT